MSAALGRPWITKSSRQESSQEYFLGRRPGNFTTLARGRACSRDIAPPVRFLSDSAQALSSVRLLLRTSPPGRNRTYITSFGSSRPIR
jgi:hypothetical protein